MSANPDWMTFDEDDQQCSPTSGVPAYALAGEGAPQQLSPLAQNYTGGSNTGDDVPLFLRDDDVDVASSAVRHASPNSVAGSHATPAFLSGFPGADNAATHSSGKPTGDAAHHAPAHNNGAHLSADHHTNGGGSGGGAVMYADQHSAAVLHFMGDSGTTWSLHRVRILGKGNYGCATLYALDEEAGKEEEAAVAGAEKAKATAQQTAKSAAAAAAPPPPPPRRAVVVKDINVQTMVNPAEDMPAVQNELAVLRSAAGHPNLVQFVDALFDSRPASYPVCFIVMEYAAGGDLAALLERCGSAGAHATGGGSGSSGGSGNAPPNPRPTSAAAALSSPSSSSSPFAPAPVFAAADGGVHMIPEDLVASYLIQTAVALQSLHTEHGILHRDVKPHNIFLLEDGVTVRLGDFGIAMQLGRVGEKAKEACGSPYFMAPEIFEERPYDAAADVWSLGVVFYQLVTHQLPFTAASVGALSTLVRRGQYARLSDTSQGVSSSSSSGGAGVTKAMVYSKELRELIDSLLTVDPAARPTLRRILRSRYVKEHLRCVPATVLQARKPVVAAAAGVAVASRADKVRNGGGMKGGAMDVQWTQEGLYASVFGKEAVAEAVAHAVYPGVSPIVERVSFS